MLPSILRLLTGVIISFLTLVGYGQTKTQYTCGDDQFRALLRTVDTLYDAMQQRSNVQLRDYAKQVEKNKPKTNYQGRTAADSAYVIPVVVHIIYPAGQAYGTGTNISYAQVRSQIEALNAAFGKDYPAYNGQSHPGYAADTHIRFCLARNTGDTTNWAMGPGGREFGVMRYADNTGAYNHNIDTYSANQLLHITHPSVSSFPFDKYLNIWLVNTIGGGNNVMGYAPRPILPGYLLDGVVMRADIFGDNTTGGGYDLGFGLGQGKILAHEAGHYFNLYHIFQDGCAGANAAGAAFDACDLNGDMICDIEPATTQNIFCTGNIPNSCSANYAAGTTDKDMINDYMSYADDDCMNTFTHDQVQRMSATLQLQRPAIWQPENLAQTGVLGTDGCVPPYLNAQIKTANAVFCAGTSIHFSNPTEGNTATGYEWHFAGGNPSSSDANSVTVAYTQPGNYTAILTVSDGNNVRTDSLLFSVLECKLDSSMLFSSHWYFGKFGSLDFSSGAPVETNVALVNQSIQDESTYAGQPSFIQATVSLSDSMGNLLFYSNGASVWNRNHKKITTSPMFGASDINASTGVCYVPYPKHPGKFFIVGASANLYVAPEGVKFAEVDINTETVKSGDSLRNSASPAKFSELLTVVPHCNGTDYWIIAHGYSFDTKFYSFLVTEAGIDPNQVPVVSPVTHPAYQGSGNQLKANRKGDKLILGSPHGYLDIEAGAVYDFDNRTGKISNERLIPNVSGYNNIQTGVAFSPNDQYFYLMRSTNLATNGPPYWLFQYKVQDFTYNIFDAPGFYFAAPFQMGPDNQIYVATQDHFVARISNPDVWRGATVNGSFINMRDLDDNIRTGVSLPAFIDARQPKPDHPEFSVTAVNCNTFTFSSLCFNDYIATWNFGDGSPLQTGNMIDHHFATAGTFTVKLTLSKDSVTYGSALKKVDVLPLTASINGPDFVCTNGNFSTQYYAPLLSDVTYRWSVPGGGKLIGPDNFPFADVVWSPTNIKGNITLDISREGCSFSAAKTVNISPGPSFTWSVPDSVCIFDSSLTLVASPAGGSFTGPGVSGNTFSPKVAGLGNHTLTYTYLNDGICLGQAERTIKVKNCNIPTDQNTDCLDLLSSIQVAPNPVAGVLRLKSPYALKFFQLYNSSGQKVLQGQLTNNSIHLPIMAAGLYSVLVYCEKNMSHKAFLFVKQ